MAMQQILVGVLTVYVCYILQAELVELNALHPHAIDHLPCGYIHEHLLGSSESCDLC